MKRIKELAQTPVKRASPLEKEIEKRVCTYAKGKGVITYKFTSPSQRSVPDRIFIFPTGHHIYVEFKRGGEVSTKAQTWEQKRLIAQGCEVRVIDNVRDGKTLVDLTPISLGGYEFI